MQEIYLFTENKKNYSGRMGVITVRSVLNFYPIPKINNPPLKYHLTFVLI